VAVQEMDNFFEQLFIFLVGQLVSLPDLNNHQSQVCTHYCIFHDKPQVPLRFYL